MVVLVRSDGFRRSFHRSIVDLMQICLDLTEALGYDVEPWQSWGYSCRAVAGTSSPSNHSWGTAVDVNAQDNPRRRDRRFQSNLPAAVVRMWEGVGFRWGGRWNWPDPMHFDWPGTAIQAEQKARDLRAFFAAAGGKTPPPALPAGGYMIPPTVRRGSTGKVVRKMQGLLAAHGGTQLCPPDGIFGPTTEAVLRYFQGSGNDGICGPITWRRLIEQ
jgi:hypothetical protein